MKLNAKFLACVSEVFTNDQGTDVAYFRLHLWMPDTHEYLKLPIRTAAAEYAKGAYKFGDDVEVPVGFRVNSKGTKEIAVIDWTN